MVARGCSCPAAWMPSGGRLEMRDSRTYIPKCCGQSRIWGSCAGVLGGNVWRTLSEHLDARHATSSRYMALSRRCSSCVLALQQPKSRIEGRYLPAWTCCFLAPAVAVDKAALISKLCGLEHWRCGFIGPLSLIYHNQESSYKNVHVSGPFGNCQNEPTFCLRACNVERIR